MNRLTRLTLPRPSLESFLLFLIIVVALALRLNGMNWDSGYGFHPDERSFYMRAGCMYDVLFENPGYRDQGCFKEHPEMRPGLPGIRTLFDFEQSPLNPHWFPLGSVLIYILVFFRWIIESFTEIGALDMRYVGRSLSALADVGSVALVYVLGRRIYRRGYGSWVGILAATLVAFAVIHVQHSHFYRPETFSALLTLASFWAMFQVLENRRLRDSLLLGALVGVAFTPKVTILPIALPLILTYCLRLWDAGNGGFSTLTRRTIEQPVLHGLAALSVALLVFFVLSPYALLYLSNFLGEQATQAEMARNAGLWPFTIQYVGTPAFFYQFKQTAFWGLGPPLGIAAWLSIPVVAWFVWRGSFARRSELLILLWVVPSILFLETFEVRFQRYYFAIIPFMILLASRALLWAPFQFASWAGLWGRRIPPLGLGQAPRASIPGQGRLWSAWEYFRNNPRGQRFLVYLSASIVVIVTISTVFYSLAFQRVYSEPHPAVAASQWLNEQLPSGVRIVSDNHWDEFIPELYGFDVWQFPAYEPDNVAKMAELSQRLADAQYLVFYSQRPYVSVASDPERFPLSGEYYRRLFAGELGYTLERRFTSHPSFLGFEIVDDSTSRTGLAMPEPAVRESASAITLNWGYADDNVVGYDHPTVLVFRNRDNLPVEIILAILATGQEKAIVNLKLTEEQRLVQQGGGSWFELFDRDSLANRVPILVWLLVVELIYLASIPLCLFLFRPLADRGVILARLVGLLGVAYITWLVVSLGWVEFSGLAIWIGVLSIAGLSGLALAAQWEAVKTFLRAKWRLLLTGEVIFLTAFLTFALIRALNPDLWHPYRGGEKPMELAYFNAVIRSTLMPPYDPWFAGGYLNYYYWGYFILAIPTRLAGIVPTVAFNLAVPLLFALTITGAYSVVYNLAEGVRRSRRPDQFVAADSKLPDADSEYAGDYVATPGQSHSRLETALRSPVAAGLTGALFVAVISNLDGTVQLVQRAWGRLLGDVPSVLPLDFWRSSRMFPNSESVEPGLLTFWLWDSVGAVSEVSWHITEFPYFSFLFADLHAHMMAIPFTILVIGLGLNLVTGARRLSWTWDVAAVVVLSIALGSLWLINSWDFPTYLLLTMALVALASLKTIESPKSRLGWTLSVSLAISAISLLAFLPFHQAVETFDTGIEATRWKTPLVNFLGIHGLFLLIVGGFLAWQARRPLYIVVGNSFGLKYLDVAVETDSRWLAHQMWLRLFTAAGLLGLVLFLGAGYYTASALVGLLTLVGLVSWDLLMLRGRDRAYSLFPMALTALALGLGIGVDLVRVEGDIGRMNTLFKYYLEMWVLLGLAAAFFLWRMGYDNRFRPFPMRGFRLVGLGIIVMLIIASLAYTVFGTQARVDDRFNALSPTLDGTAYMSEAVHWEKDQPIELKWDQEAIEWLQENVEGSPVILEAHTEQYRWGGRIANYTGLPTILGWPWHQIQQRGPYSEEVHERAGHVQEIYQTGDMGLARELMSKYHVKFAVVGDLERIFYPGEGLDKFDIMVQQGTAAKVFDNGHTSIYQVAHEMAVMP